MVAPEDLLQLIKLRDKHLSCSEGHEGGRRLWTSIHTSGPQCGDTGLWRHQTTLSLFCGHSITSYSMK